MDQPYVTETDGAYRLTGHRISLDSIVYAWLAGQSPEMILDDFPSLTLEEIYGAIAFYLARREEIDQHLRQSEAQFETLKAKWRAANPLLWERLAAYKSRQHQQRAA